MFAKHKYCKNYFAHCCNWGWKYKVNACNARWAAPLAAAHLLVWESMPQSKQEAQVRSFSSVTSQKPKRPAAAEVPNQNTAGVCWDTSTGSEPQGIRVTASQVDLHLSEQKRCRCWATIRRVVSKTQKYLVLKQVTGRTNGHVSTWNHKNQL